MINVFQKISSGNNSQISRSRESEDSKLIYGKVVSSEINSIATKNMAKLYYRYGAM
jgi:hypothetical protein